MHLALGVDIVTAAAYDLAGALEPGDTRLGCADNLALEVGVVILDAVYLSEKKWIIQPCLRIVFFYK